MPTPRRAPSQAASTCLAEPVLSSEVSRLEEAFSLLARAMIRLMSSREVGTWTRRLTGQLDRSSYLILADLRESGPVRVTDLAQRARLDVSTVSRCLRQLSDAGLVRKVPDSTDGRAFRVELSEKGAELLESACSAKRELLTAATSGWSQRARASLAAQMMRLARSLEGIEELDADERSQTTSHKESA